MATTKKATGRLRVAGPVREWNEPKTIEDLESALQVFMTQTLGLCVGGSRGDLDTCLDDEGDVRIFIAPHSESTPMMLTDDELDVVLKMRRKETVAAAPSDRDAIAAVLHPLLEVVRWRRAQYFQALDWKARKVPQGDPDAARGEYGHALGLMGMATRSAFSVPSDKCLTRPIAASVDGALIVVAPDLTDLENDLVHVVEAEHVRTF